MEQSEANSTVLTRIVRISNKRGLHARAAAKLVSEAERYGANVSLTKSSADRAKTFKDSEAVSARSIMGLLMLGAGMGSYVEIKAEGWDAKEVLDALVTLIEAGFHEQE